MGVVDVEVAQPWRDETPLSLSVSPLQASLLLALEGRDEMRVADVAAAMKVPAPRVIALAGIWISNGVISISRGGGDGDPSAVLKLITSSAVAAGVNSSSGDGAATMDASNDNDGDTAAESDALVEGFVLGKYTQRSAGGRPQMTRHSIPTPHISLLH